MNDAGHARDIQIRHNSRSRLHLHPTRLLSLLLVLLAWPVAVTASPICTGVGGPDRASNFGPDDLNISHTQPCPAEFLAGGGSTTGGSDWLMTALTSSGFGKSEGWNFSYASEATGVNLILNFDVFDYYAWVVNEPDVSAPNGLSFPGRVHDADAGGAVFVLSYKPLLATDPDPSKVHWVQAYRQSLNGDPYEIRLDNPGGAASPFYDVGGAAGTYSLLDGSGIGSWFLDTPLDCETKNILTCESAEGIEDYHTNVEFNVFLAVENEPRDVTLYAGDHWGYVYTTADTPEPRSIYMVLGGVALFVLHRVRSAKAVA
jgi:hypothetical protein